MLRHDSPLPAASLDDDALIQKVVSLSGNERERLVDFLQYLGELDARRLYLAQGYSSLFDYCSGFLRLSNASAHRRYTTARLMRRFPLIADFLRSGRLNTARVALLRDVLTEQNHPELLERATHGTEKDVERLVATLNPKPNVTDGIRKLPSPRPVPALTSLVPLPAPLAPTSNAAPAPLSTAASSVPSTTPLASPGTEPLPLLPETASSVPLPVPPASATTPARPPVERVGPNTQHGFQSALAAEPRGATTMSTPAPRPHRMDVEATSGTTFSVRMSVGSEFIAEFEAVKAALSHKVPNGNFEAVMRECFRMTLEFVNRRRAGAGRNRTVGGASTTGSGSSTPAPHAASKNASAETASSATSSGRDATAEPSSSATARPSRYIPAPVRAAVWSRDVGQCAFVSKNGRRCNSKYQLEVHHIDPYARGGPATVENLSLRCRQHNRHEAAVAFGAAFMRSLPFWKCEDSAVPSLQVGPASIVEVDRGLVAGLTTTDAPALGFADRH